MQHPAITPAVFADDVQLLITGEEGEIARAMACATRHIIDSLENECLLRVSTDKLVVVASAPKVAEAVCGRVARLRRARRATARNLGVEYAAGGRLRRAVQNMRVKNAVIMAARLKKIRRAGGHTVHVMRSILLAVGLYGVEVVGMLRSQLQRLRTATHSVLYNKASCRSATIDFALVGPRMDPEYYVRTAPVV